MRSSLSKIEYKRTAEEIKLEEDKAKYLKCREQKVKDLEFEKTSFLSMLDKKENKLMKKKDKIHNLRSLIAELREKLNHFSDKDLQNFTLLKMKEAYL